MTETGNIGFELNLSEYLINALKNRWLQCNFEGLESTFTNNKVRVNLRL